MRGATDEDLVLALDLEEGFVTAADGVRLHYVAGGAGPLVLFLHGFPEHWYTWRHQLPALAAERRVVAVDLRGYHRSDRPAGRRAYAGDRLLADVVALVEALGDGRATLVGHDWGGAIAWAFAHAHPGMLERLVICNAPHPARFAAEIARPPQLLRSWYVFLLQLPRLPEALLCWHDAAAVGWILRHAAGGPDALGEEAVARFRAAFAEPGAARAAVDYYRNLAGGMRRRPPLAPIEAPVLVLWGDRDPALDARLLRGLERLAPQVRVRRFAGAGHFVHEELPSAVNAALREFLLEPA